MFVVINRKIVKAIFIVLVLIVVGIFCWYVGQPLVKFASEPEKFRVWVNSNGIWGRIAYMGMMVLQILAAFLPGEPFEMVAGYAFGSVEGTLLCFLASAIGSVLVLLLARKFGLKFVSLFFNEDKIKSAKFLQSSPKKTLLFSVIFALPGTPKDLLCYFAGLTDIKLWKLVLICSFGRILAIVTSTLGGDALGTESYILAIIVFIVTIFISFLGVWVYNILSKRNK